MGRIQVLLDDQIFLLDSHGGISRYFAELLREFRSHPQWEVEPLVSLTRSPNVHLRDVDTSIRDLPFAEGSPGWKAAKRFERYTSGRRAARMRPDLVHQTFYRDFALDELPGIPRVVTVHDMAPERMPEAFPEGNPHMSKREFVARADALIFVSEATRDDLFDLWGPITDRPVLVTPHATSPRFNTDVEPHFEGYPYLLHVGSRASYKDFSTLLEAYARSHARAAGVQLLAVGGGALTAAETDLASALGIAGLVHQRTPDDDQLPGYYRGAEVLVYPSRFEGFGIPVVEAMASGCPTVLSDIPAFREVGADAASYFPVGDAAALAEAVDLILEAGDVDNFGLDDDSGAGWLEVTLASGGLRADLIKRGLRRAEVFSWETTADATAQLYRQVLEENS